jgi:hypothetical protein
MIKISNVGELRKALEKYSDEKLIVHEDHDEIVGLGIIDWESDFDNEQPLSFVPDVED